MIVKLYWGSRLVGYVACLAGIFIYLYRQADADPAASQFGLGLVGFGFVAFFVSYALRAWLRHGPARRDRENPAP